MNVQYINGENQGMAVGYATAMSNVGCVAIHLQGRGYAQSFAYAYDALSNSRDKTGEGDYGGFYLK